MSRTWRTVSEWRCPWLVMVSSVRRSFLPLLPLARSTTRLILRGEGSNVTSRRKTAELECSLSTSRVSGNVCCGSRRVCR